MGVAEVGRAQNVALQNETMYGEVVPYYHSSFHHELHVLEFADIGEWIARYSDDVCVVPGVN